MTKKILNSRDINDADSILQKAHKHVLQTWNDLYPSLPNPILVQTYRDNRIQEVIYMQGRFTHTAVNVERKKLNLAPISEKENRIITHKKTGSKHGIYPSKALDYMFMDGKRLVTSAKESKDLYNKLAKIILTFNENIRWGGDWNGNGSSEDEKFLDMPHFEI